MKEARCSECDSRLAKSASIVEVGKCRSCAPAYTIKGLEWKVWRDGKCHTASTAFGIYSVTQTKDSPSGFSVNRPTEWGNDVTALSIEDGKAKAEAHYRHLMESCLEVVK